MLTFYHALIIISIVIKNHVLNERGNNISMTNTELLRQKIYQSGYRIRYIADKLGISYPTLQSRIDGETEFKSDEVIILKELLQLTEDEVIEIFYSKIFT